MTLSRFFSEKYAALTPYTPGEQPRERTYIKLNTNESPFETSPLAVEMAAKEAARARLYSDPTCHDLVRTAAAYFGVDPDEVLFTNGSDEILNFAFMAFGDASHPAVFPDITYGFYPVFAALGGVPYEEKPLNDDFTVNVDDYLHTHKTIFIANPNAPTGIALTKSEIERIVAENADSVVVVDEAYVDFGAESVVPLIHTYDNLLVTQTFSKSRSLAGARLGMGFGCKALIADLNTVKYSTNPYNVNRMTMAAGVGALLDDEYMKKNCAEIIRVRGILTNELRRLGFSVLDSKANFVFAKSDTIGGEALYKLLKENGILVRHFTSPRLCEYNRITVGTEEQTRVLVRTLETLLGK